VYQGSKYLDFKTPKNYRNINKCSLNKEVISNTIQIIDSRNDIFNFDDSSSDCIKLNDNNSQKIVLLNSNIKSYSETKPSLKEK